MTGATTVTASFLARFVYRRRLVFALIGWQRVLVFLLGLLMLAGTIYLNGYGHALVAAEELLSTPAP